MSSRVKAVQTGDCLILASPGEEKQVFLAYVSTPRITEPWGFAAREYLRRFALNKPVRYRSIYEVNGREHGDASSPVFTSLVEHLLSQGWAKLRSDASSRPGYAQLAERFEAAEAEAQSAHRGIWSEKTPAPTVNLLTEVPPEIYGSGRKVPAIVERVQNGDRVILRAMFKENEHFVGPAFLGGIRTRPPVTGASTGASTGSSASTGGSESSPAGPNTAGTTSAASAATFTVETRILQRDVRAVFHAPHASGHPLVTLIHPAGDIAQLLVSQGLAEVVQTPEIGSENLLALRAAQQDAVKRGVGIWKAAAAQRQAQHQKFAHLSRDGVVTRIISADTIVVDNDTVQLSSVRAPRRTEDPEAAQDAREFVRKLLIGQKVKVSVDGAAPAPPVSGSAPSNESVAKVTLSYGPSFSKNVGLETIKAGWATALRHRRDDLARSPFYDEFLAAEESAERARLGIHAPKKNSKTSSAPRAVQDASESVVRARAYLSSLQRRNSFPAVIDFVISAGRVRLNVPSENCTLVAVLDGAQVPRAGEPFSSEALAFVAREWNQRDVTCRVRSVDKTGAFVSTISMGRRTLALDLVERGLARVFGSSSPEIEDAEEKAQSKKLGIWSIESIDDEVEPSTTTVSTPSHSAVSTEASTGYQDAVVAHVTPDELYVRLAPQQAQHVHLQSSLKQFFTAAVNAHARSFGDRPRRRTPVVDASSYERGVVTAVRGSTCEVEFVDTGAVVQREVAQLLPMPQQFAVGAQFPAQARPIHLQFVHRPVKFYEARYVEYLQELIGKTVVIHGNTVYTADSKSAEDSLNTRLVKAGLASVPVSDSKEPGVESALTAQSEAQEKRLGMWEYGDPREDDDM